MLAFAFWALAEGSAAAIVPITAALLHEAGHLLAMSLCGVPVDRMLEGEKEKLLKMEEQLIKRVVGQAQAVRAVSTAVRRA